MFYLHYQIRFLQIFAQAFLRSEECTERLCLDGNKVTAGSIIDQIVSLVTLNDVFITNQYDNIQNIFK